MKTKTSQIKHMPSTPAMIAGIAAGVMILSAIAFSTRHFFIFFNLEGVLIVGGGVLAAACMSYHPDDVRAALRSIRDMFHEPPISKDALRRDVIGILAWAQVARLKGMRDLEMKANRTGVDDFVRYGLDMAVSNYTPADVRAMMETATDAAFERETAPALVLQSMASHAPAFGMIGTLIGMVTMLASLGDTAAGIGPGLAVSFLSTLYGVISARMLYMPAAARLMQKAEATRFRNDLVTEGMVMLVENRSPAFIQDRLNGFLKPEARYAMASSPAPTPLIRLETRGAA
jgi:chemotaxis protein MotA